MKPIKLLNHSTRIKRAIYRVVWSNPLRQPKSILWQELNRLGRNATFLDVGANDGLSGSPVAEFILQKGWRGVMVEPVWHVFERLSENYRGQAGVTLINAAVSDETGYRDFWYLERNTELLPGYDQLGSFDKACLLASAEKMFPGYEKYLKSQSVPCVAMRVLPYLLASRKKRFDVVLVDAEGADAMIVRQIDFQVNPPKLIIYEHIHLPKAEQEALGVFLKGHGYTLKSEAGDTLAVNEGLMRDA